MAPGPMHWLCGDGLSMPWIKPSWAPGGWRRSATGIDQREFRHLLTLTVASMGAGPAARISDCAIGLLPTGAHEKDRVWQLLSENKLPETTLDQLSRRGALLQGRCAARTIEGG